MDYFQWYHKSGHCCGGKKFKKKKEKRKKKLKDITFDCHDFGGYSNM